MKNRLWVRMAAIFLFASVVPIVGAAVLTVHLMQESVRDDAARKHLALADLGGALVNDYIRRGTEKLTTVSGLLAKELIESQVGEYSKTNKAYRSTVVDKLNRLVQPPDLYLDIQYYANGNEPEFVGQAQQESYQSAQQMDVHNEKLQQKQIAANVQNPIVNDPILANRNFNALQLEDNFGFPTLPMSVPVGKGKRPLGAVVGYLDWREVSKILGTVSKSGYHVRVTNGDGVLVAEAGIDTGDLMGQSRYAGYSDWMVEVREPSSRVYAALGQVRQQAFLWAGLAVLLAFGFSIAVSRRIVQPVTELTHAAERMEKGDLKVRTGITTTDEIGKLGQAFDRMATAVEKLDEAKSEFIGNVSHELRTPLTSIRLSIANLLDGVVGTIDDKQRLTLDRLRGDVDRMITMVNDLLEMARLDAGAIDAKKTNVDLAILVGECAAGIQPLASERHISIKVEGAGSADVDRRMIHRVITNLLDNAVKFSPEGGTVRVAVADREMKVSDSGPGVPSEGLFDKFTQGTQEGVKNKGVGLGLAIVKKLVELHGGSVSVENDDGAVFTVRL